MKKNVSIFTLLERNKSVFEKDYNFSKEEKKNVLEAVKNYGVYGEVIYGKENVKETIEEIVEMCEIVEQMTLQETDEWFDSVTVSRDMKELKKLKELFIKAAKEYIPAKQRLEALYEDIGKKLSRYYDV